jgi:mannitol/fructose-specific phosphotransferase system IIA component (Ntr-type)
MKLSDLIVTDAIIPQLASTTRDEAIAELMTALSDVGAINADSVQGATDAILAREAQATTGIGKGIAFPHARIKGVKKAVGVIGCSSEGIGFDSLDGKPVDMVVLLLSSPEDADEHLQAMETIFRHVHREAFRAELRACQTKDEMVTLVENADITE